MTLGQGSYRRNSARVVVNDFPSVRSAPEDQSKTTGCVSTAGRGPLQGELSACQSDSVREWANFNFKGQLAHRLARRIGTAVTGQNQPDAAMDDLAANKRRFG